MDRETGRKNDNSEKTGRAVGLYRLLGGCIRFINWAGMLACLCAALLVACNVLLRKLSGSAVSIPGAGEFSAYALVVMTMTGIPALQLQHKHIRTDILVARLPESGRRRWESAVDVLEAAVGVLFCWGGVRKMAFFLETGAVTDVLGIPKWPFALICLVSFAAFTLLMLLDAVLVLQDADMKTRENEVQSE